MADDLNLTFHIEYRKVKQSIVHFINEKVRRITDAILVKRYSPHDRLSHTNKKEFLLYWQEFF